MIVGGVAAAMARADSPDVKVSSPAPGQHPFQTGTATVDAATGHVTVKLIGGWSWPTHGSDCNLNRAGVGIAVNWFDPGDRGFHVAFFDVDNTGTVDKTPGGPDDFGVGATGANGLNAADDVVHPTENDTGNGAVVNITDPSGFANWRGGCGVFSTDTILVNNGGGNFSYTTGTVAHGNFGNPTPASTDVSGTPFDNPTPPSNSSLQGALLQHVYASKADVTRVCALTYDVHPGTNASANNGVGIPSKDSEVTSGDQAVASGAQYTKIHNGDNSIESNGGTPTGNSCPTFKFPNNPSIATKLSESSGKSGDTVHDTATLSGATASAGGKVTYTVYSNSACSSKFADAGTVSVTNGSVPASNNVTFPHAGTFYWQASYSGDADNTQAVSACTSEQLVIAPVVDLSIVKSASPAQVTLGKGNITWTMVVANHGPDSDTGVTVTDPIPAGTTFVSVSTTKGTCTGGAIISCNIGAMAAGESVTITLVTTPTRAGTLVNNVTVVGDKPEITTNNNSSSASAVVVGFTPPVVFCTAVSKVTPKQLFVGRKATLTIHVTRHGKAVKGVRVLIRGKGLLIRTKPSNAKGVIKQNVKVAKAGALIFAPIASKRCNTKRIGVTGVFTPPVTG
jgi:uncharacterized repeat protein (TIGR01451 family)